VHPFLLALNTAYDKHYPLILSPDMIWLLILQGLASHVNANSQALRTKFVNHDGKLVLHVRRNGFRIGDPANDWQGVFGEFSASLRGHLGADTHGLLVNQFSTTGPAEQAAMEVVLMDTVQAYFTYSMSTLCGFPSITLEGTPADWQQLRERAKGLPSFDLDWWIPHLLPVLDQFVRAAEANPDKDFWCNFFKLAAGGSGATRIHGHCLNLFPYLGKQRPTNERLLADFETFRRSQYGGSTIEVEIQADIGQFKTDLKKRGLQKPDEDQTFGSLRRNTYLGKAPLKRHEGFTTDDVSTKLGTAPMIWDYFGTKKQMELLAGFIGFTQDPATLAIRPTIGWAVRHGVA
jgi:Domain of unknown function (DUF4419)